MTHKDPYEMGVAREELIAYIHGGNTIEEYIQDTRDMGQEACISTYTKEDFPSFQTYRKERGVRRLSSTDDARGAERGANVSKSGKNARGISKDTRYDLDDIPLPTDKGETTHVIEKIEGYQDFRKVVIDMINENTVYAKIAQDTANKYRLDPRTKGMTEAEIEAEVVAEVAKKIVKNPTQFLKDVKHDKTALQKLADFFERLLEGFKNMFTSAERQSVKKAYDLLVKAVKNAKTTQVVEVGAVETVKYDIDKTLDNMSEARYNKYGWAFVDLLKTGAKGIESERKIFFDKVDEIKHQGNYCARDKEGNYIISVTNKLVLTNVKGHFPTIHKVIELTHKDADEMGVAREELIDYISEGNKIEEYIHDERLVEQASYINTYTKKDMSSLQEYREKSRIRRLSTADDARGEGRGENVSKSGGDEGGIFKTTKYDLDDIPPPTAVDAPPSRGMDKQDFGKDRVFLKKDVKEIAEEVLSGVFEESEYEGSLSNSKLEYLFSELNESVNKSLKEREQATNRIVDYFIEEMTVKSYLVTEGKDLSVEKVKAFKEYYKQVNKILKMAHNSIMENTNLQLAQKRTKLANIRTFLSYIRTSLLSLSVALAFVKLDKENPLDFYSITLLIFSAIFLIIGLVNFFITNHSILSKVNEKQF